MSASIISSESESILPYKAISFSGDSNEYVVIGNHKYLRNELMEAFGGTLNPGLSPPPVHKFGNASALGLGAFSLTAFTLGLYLVGTLHIENPDLIVSLLFFYGGTCLMLSGIWELVIGNTFAATAFCSLGPFFWGYGAILVPSFGISAAYADEPEQLANAIGFYFLGWGIFAFMLLMCTFKSTVMFISTVLTTDIAFFLLAAGSMTGSPTCNKAAGIFVIITSLCGWYCMYEGIANKTNSYLVPPPMPLPVLGSH
ncbi:GPR1/FUN34/yaaH family-domain-containing protein [Scheffersomyces amazonensis]|uniref:GPR1/FUN34/yaaH family-domain-containing protein n=1 Tax=Scheffersomyces amazonensis TaxID=1078765 RepID=UPI00315DEE8C